jgi:NhaA family Na+:H+ antiporter
MREEADSHDLIEPLQRMENAQREAIPPVVRLESMLNPWVAFVIMPLFALSNAGVTISMDSMAAPGATSLALGVILGLAVGKPLGIVGVSLLAARAGICSLPRGVDARGLLVVGAVGGIGFTMALFIAQLAFVDPTRLGVAKIAVLAGSLLAGVFGVLVGLFVCKPADIDLALSVDEAERSTNL